MPLNPAQAAVVAAGSSGAVQLEYLSYLPSLRDASPLRSGRLVGESVCCRNRLAAYKAAAMACAAIGVLPALAAPQRSSSSSIQRNALGSSFLSGAKQQFAGRTLALQASSSSQTPQRRVVTMAAKGEASDLAMHHRQWCNDAWACSAYQALGKPSNTFGMAYRPRKVGSDGSFAEHTVAALLAASKHHVAVPHPATLLTACSHRHD
jgi:hypothetical protein